MIRLIARRIGLGAVTLWVVSVLIFAATEVLPGDAATAILGPAGTPETIAALRESLGLDRSPPARYASWIAHFAEGDIGKSLANGREIGPELRWRLGNTAFLACTTALVAVPLSILLGLLAAIHQNSFIDRCINAFTLITVSIPEFLIGYLLVLLFSVRLRWFPSLAMLSDDMDVWARLHAIVLPAMTMLLVVLALMVRQTRASVISVLSSSFIETAFLKGIANWRIILQHALPNALAPIINVIALNIAYLIVGVVVVEVIFVYPGVGQMLVDSVSKRDVPVVQACGLIFATAYVALNMVADVTGILSNPRLRHPR